MDVSLRIQARLKEEFSDDFITIKIIVSSVLLPMLGWLSGVPVKMWHSILNSSGTPAVITIPPL